MSRGFLLLVVLGSAMTFADTAVYRWVDAGGMVHYSDQPHPGAVKVDLGAPQIIEFKTSPATTLAAAQVTIVRPATQQLYELRIVAPADGTTLRPADYEVRVRVAVAPPLAANARLQYMLDGEPAGAPTTATTLLLQKVYRGAHTLTVTALGADDQAAGTASSTFYVHRHSALFNRRQPGPKPGSGG